MFMLHYATLHKHCSVLCILSCTAPFSLETYIPDPQSPGLLCLLCLSFYRSFPGPTRTFFLPRCGWFSPVHLLERIYILTNRKLGVKRMKLSERISSFKNMLLKASFFWFFPDHTQVNCFPARSVTDYEESGEKLLSISITDQTKSLPKQSPKFWTGRKGAIATQSNWPRS